MAKQGKTTVVTQQVKFEEFKADLMAIGLYQDSRSVPAAFAKLDKAADGKIADLLKLGDFAGKANETAVVYVNGKSPCPRVMLVGLGKQEDLKLNTLRQAAGVAARRADRLGAAKVALALHASVAGFDGEEVGRVLAEGALAGRYDFRDYVTQENTNGRKVGDMRITIVEPEAKTLGKIKSGAKLGTIIGEAQNEARRLANQPGNEINPPVLAAQARRLAKKFGFVCKVYDEKQLARMKMNAILAVGRGSVHKPRLIVLEYTGRKGKGGKKAAIDLAVVGKAVTFDTGGVNLKPTPFLDGMKFDKCGGCAVLGIMSGLARLKAGVNVLGLIPSVENMLSGDSWRPDDIIRTYSGKTVEVRNTDAEGRMILCDALAFAAERKPGAIIDMATLTGACRVALGEFYAGLFTNRDELKDKLLSAAERSGEPLWHLPSGPQYAEQMKSKVADLKNVAGREGGACNAAAFLGQFVGETPWAHLDIAATADTDEEKPYRAAGATGFGVRLILQYLEALGQGS